MQQLDAEAEEVARHLERQPFPVLAGALRSRAGEILVHWRRRSIEVMPTLDRLTIVEFDDSIAIILGAIADALEKPGIERVRRLMEVSPAHGSSRFTQKVEPHVMLAEERILRSAVIVELRAGLGRPLYPEEASAFHELFDLMSEYSLLRLIHARSEARDQRILDHFSGMQRLVDLGTLAAGLAHDAANLMLPIRTRLDFLSSTELPPETHNDVEGLLLLIDQLQDFIINLRMLSVDPHRRGIVGDGATLESRWAEKRAATVDVGAWWNRVAKFHRRMLPYHIELVGDVSPDLPRVAVPAPVLSQAMFNLIRNAQNALRGQGKGCITVRAASGADGRFIDLFVEDDGPGMSAMVLAYCFEPFYSGPSAAPPRLEGATDGADGSADKTSERAAIGLEVTSGSGLGLAIVNAMVTGAGGRVSVQSPPPGKARGTLFVLSLPVA